MAAQVSYSISTAESVPIAILRHAVALKVQGMPACMHMCVHVCIASFIIIIIIIMFV